MSRYRDELIKSMSMLAQNKDVVFLGQCVKYPGHIMYGTLEHIPDDRKIELPVFEDTQIGMGIGLALEGFIPVSIFPRMDFLIIAANQLVNHLDKIEDMSRGQFKPKVIIRTMVGSITPMYPGPQHCQDHTDALLCMLPSIDIVKLTEADEILPAYRKALKSERSTILIEAPPKREGYED